ncbi:MAG: transposase [Lachnospiraceae bacterium]|nr:transposase [Lachnospiraceae bacterium]
MAGRKADPATQYRVFLQKVADKYVYASVQRPYSVDGSTRLKYKPFHLGTVNSDMVFTPNSDFRLLPVSERIKYTFPEGIDVSKVEAMNHMEYAHYQMEDNDAAQGSVAGQEAVTATDPKRSDTADGHDNSSLPAAIENQKKPDTPQDASLPCENILDQYNNRLYGSFWLLEEICRRKGVDEDLLKTFQGNIAIVNEIMSLAFFPYLSGKCFNRFAKWQNSHKTLLDYPLTSPSITRLSQSITDHHRMTFIKLRLKRQPEGAFLDCDSTSKSGWGRCLVDLCWGNNKDNPKLQNTVEAYVYSITTHEPVYYRSFPGNTADISTVRTILADLQALGIKDVVFIADRGYPSEENLAALVEASLPFLMCAKAGCNPIAPLLHEVKFDEDGVPVNMNYDGKRKLYYLQVEIPAYSGELADGTAVNMAGLAANLFLNVRRRAEELGALKRKIQEERQLLEAAASEGAIPKDIKKYNALFDYFKVVQKTDSQGKATGIEFSLCAKKVDKERSICGFFSSIMHKMNIDGAKALEIYKSRDEHEKNFDQLKNQMLQYVQRNSSEDGRNGRSFISFVGLIAVSEVRHAWKEKMQDRFESSVDMLDELESIRFSEYTNGSTHMSSFTAKQVEICDACNVTVPKECMPSTVRKAKERKENPKKRGPKPKPKTDTACE